MQEDFSICLVGAGNMGGAMLAGWLQSGVLAERICVVDPNPPEKMMQAMQNAGVKHWTSADAGAPMDVIIVAVKPQIIESVLPGLKSLIGPNSALVSVAAGTSIDTVEKHLGQIAIVRAMPNTPALVLKGMSGCFANDKTSETHKAQIEDLLLSIGAVAWVESEEQINAVTAVSGSGPAYVFHLAECMQNAGIEAGLSSELSMQLARQTIAGAGEMLARIDEEASQMRKNVTSPNGTTAAALDVFMGEPSLQALVTKAVLAAQKRSEELS